jgi:peptidyl-prolyl cis-trans isomerase B (cyclophilin B)
MFSVLTLALALSGQSFDEGTRPSPRDAPEETLGGKKTKEIVDAVKKDWDSIQFEKDGKPVEYQLTLDTDEGKIVLEFYPKSAPSHCRSMILLAKNGFYDGLKFHRCIPGFVIQGGCPLGNGTGGPGYEVKQEFNKRAHTRGTLSMARSNDPDSAGSQFFICHDDTPSLDNKYTVYGKVVSGIEVVDAIVGKPAAGDRPIKPVTIKSAKVSIKGEKPAAAPAPAASATSKAG